MLKGYGKLNARLDRRLPITIYLFPIIPYSYYIRYDEGLTLQTSAF